MASRVHYDYDEGCFDLAWKFLSDVTQNGKMVFHVRDAEALAVKIQRDIEDFIEDVRSEKKQSDDR